MALTTLGFALSGYSLGSIAISVNKFLKLDLMINNKNKIESLELYSATKNSPIYFGTHHTLVPIDLDDEYNFLGSCGKFNEKSFLNHRYIGNTSNVTFICDLTKKKYEDKLKKYDSNSYILNLIELNADKKLYLHEIKLNEAYSINDKKVAFYHESKEYLSKYYIMYIRYPFTFTSGIIGGLILFCNCF